MALPAYSDLTAIIDACEPVEVGPNYIPNVADIIPEAKPGGLHHQYVRI
jgi:hypothetical protein